MVGLGIIKMKEVDNITDAGNDFGLTAKSSVKLIKNSKGINWEIKVVKGEENLLDGLKEKAIQIHGELESSLLKGKSP